MWIVSVCVMLVALTTPSLFLRRYEVSQLTDDVMANYTMVDPSVSTNRATYIKIGYGLSTITEFNDVSGELSTSGFLLLSWQDEQIRWQPEKYQGTDTLSVYWDEIWTPSLTVLNQVNNIMAIGKDSNGKEAFKVSVEYDGNVTWSPVVVLKTSCTVNVADFPSDTQECKIQFYSWGNPKGSNKLHCQSKYVSLDFFSPSNEWNITGTRCVDEHGTAVFYLRLKRKPFHYILNLFCPVMLLGVLNGFVFVIDPNSDERISYSMTVFLSIVVFLTITSQQLPRTSDHVSVMSYYLVATLLYSAFIIVSTIITGRFYRRKQRRLDLDLDLDSGPPRGTCGDETRKSSTETKTPVRANLDIILFVVFMFFHLLSSIVFLLYVTVIVE